MNQQGDFWNIVFEFLSKFGLPTLMVLYLLSSFQKKIDRLITLIDRLTGIILKMSDRDRSDFDVDR
jgi:hypothetical protein